MQWSIYRSRSVAVSFVLLLASAAGAGEKVTIKPNLPPGTTWTFDNSQTMESRTRATANGRSQEFQTMSTSRRAGKMEVLAAENGEPTSLRITFDETCVNEMTMGSQSQKVPFPYAGKTITITRTAGGAVGDDFQGRADAQSVSELHAILSQAALVCPPQPVEIGEEWKADPKLLSQVADLKGSSDRAGMTLQLLDVSADGGKRLAKIKVSTVITRSLAGINSTVIMQGTALVDLASGHTTALQLKGPIESSGEQSGPGPGGQPMTYHVEGKGTLASNGTSNLITSRGTAGGGIGGIGGALAGATAHAREPVEVKNPGTPGRAVTPSDGVPQGYDLVSATDSGRALTTRKATQSIRSALASALPEIAGLFDGRPKITGAYEDVRDHRSGGAVFTATLQGRPVRGMVSCKLLDQGVAVAVVYAKADATPADWARLTTTNVAAGGPPLAPPTIPPLRTYEFPDNTGSVGIPDGWKTDATTCNGTVIIKGPGGQVVTMGLFIPCVTPNSMAVRTQQALAAQARQYGNRPPTQTLLVAKWAAPPAIFQALIPQLNRFAQANGKPGMDIDHLEQQSEATAILQGGKAALITYGITEVENDQRVHRRVLAQIEADPTSNESFLFWLTGAAAPDATFNQDLPTMLAVIASLRENAAVIQAKTQQKIDQQNQWFAAQQKAHRELMASYEAYNRAQARNSTIRSRSNDDFIEVIRGYRTVEDTRTGERRSVDLGNVDNIVDSLNRAEPGRYKQIPLRDESDPLGR